MVLRVLRVSLSSVLAVHVSTAIEFPLSSVLVSTKKMLLYSRMLELSKHERARSPPFTFGVWPKRLVTWTMSVVMWKVAFWFLQFPAEPSMSFV